MNHLLSLKKQCLSAVKYYSTFNMLNTSPLPLTLRESLKTLDNCCWMFDAQAALENEHETCLENAKFNQLACCSGNYFCTAVWNDHYKCAERIARLFHVDEYLESIMDQTDIKKISPVFIEPRAAVKYLMQKNFPFKSSALIWLAIEGDSETFELLLRWGCEPTKDVFSAVLADFSRKGSCEYESVFPSDFCFRKSDEALEPSVAHARQCMRKNNVNCLEALLKFAPATKRHVKRAIINDNLQCLALLLKRNYPLPESAIDIAVYWDSVDCLDFLMSSLSIDNSALSLAIEKRSFRCAKLLFLRGHSNDLALYYCVKFRCFQLLKFFTENGSVVGGLEILIDDCNFLKTAFAVNCLWVPASFREKVQKFFESGHYEQYKINQQFALCGNGKFIDFLECCDLG